MQQGVLVAPTVTGEAIKRRDASRRDVQQRGDIRFN